MSEKSKSKCETCASGGDEFDSELAFQRLSAKYDQLATAVAKLAAAMPAPIARAPYRGDRAGAPASAEAPADARQLESIIYRIVGGVKTTAYPDCCLIGHRSPNGMVGWFCTGVLVHPRIVLTAGHCVDPSSRANIVALNASEQNQLQQAEVLAVKSLHVHPYYTETRQNSDMTVLVLRQPAITSVVPIATTAEIAQAMQTTLVGFGNSDLNSTRGFGTKRVVEVDITSIRRAASDDLDEPETRLGYESNLEFCAGGEGFDSCNGDSGGPAYIDVAGVRKLAGLTSRATATAVTNCGDGGIYTRVDKHVDFIKRVADLADITSLGF